MNNFSLFLLFINIVTALCVESNGRPKESLDEKPIQLVRPDDKHKRLEIVAHNVEQLKRIVGPVATVAVVGKFHSGKSFLMNQLMRKSNGFGVGPSVRPQTMGIWMWGKPAKFKLNSGLEVSLIFLDTEGFAANNVSENYDAKIFSVATLLSSHLLYNSVKIIDQSDIDYLELLARRTQLFALRSQMSRKKWTNEFNKDLLSFPPLIWIVQDFIQSTVDNETTTQWLQRLMTTHTRENDLYEISLMDIFKSVDCHTLFIPATKKHILNDLSIATEEDLTDEYKYEREQLIRKLKAGIVPKEKNNKPITGIELAALLEILVSAANDGSLADVPNRWDAFVRRLQQTATEDCVKFYEAEMDVLIVDEYSNEPINTDKFDEWHSQSLSRSIEMLKHLLHGLNDALVKGMQLLEHDVAVIYARIRDINEKKIKLKCSQTQHELELKAEEKLRNFETPMVTSVLQSKANDVLSSTLTEFVEKIENLVDKPILNKYIDSIRNTLKNLMSAIQLENNKAIEMFLNRKLNVAIENFLKFTASDSSSRVKPKTPSLLKRILDEGNERAVKRFVDECKDFKGETIYEPILAQLKVKLLDSMNTIDSENQINAQNYIESESSILIEQFRERTSSNVIVLPVNSTELESRLKLQISKSLRDFEDRLSDFNVYKSYVKQQTNFKEKMGVICEERRNENIKAFAKEVKTPLDMAKKIVLRAHEDYSTAYKYKQFIYDICLMHLNEGKPKYWSLKLKTDIIDQFIAENSEISELIRNKKTLISEILDFGSDIIRLIEFGYKYHIITALFFMAILSFFIKKTF